MCIRDSLSVGVDYIFNGWVASLTEEFTPGATPHLDLRLDGVSVGSFAAASVDDVWQGFTIGFTPTTTAPAVLSLHDLFAVGLGDDFGLDDLTLTAVPAPSVTFLVALTLIMAAIRRRIVMRPVATR